MATSQSTPVCLHCHTRPAAPRKRGLCWGCYDRPGVRDLYPKRKVGSQPTDPESRFWPKVRKSDGCWEWQAGRNSRGYGMFSFTWRRHITAHRYSYELAHGSIPDGLEVCHHCDNPICVRPDHLFLGTHADNMADAKAKGRVAKGERKRSTKLTEAQVVEIRRLAATDETFPNIAKRFGVSVATACRAANGAGWAHLPGAVPKRSAPGKAE